MPLPMPTPGDFAPTAPLANLRRRAELMDKLRSFFRDRGFLEVDTPVLSADTVVDRHLDPIPVTLPTDGAKPLVGRPMWLQTSPEFAMKRLLAAGLPAIFQISRAFRAGEVGTLHNPEFTLAEWYRVGDGMHQGMQLLADLAEALLGQGRPELMTYQEAFQRHAGLDPHLASTKDLAEMARQFGIAVPAGLLPNDRDGWLNLLLATRIEPRLGHPRPVILYDYPASQAALARTRPGPPPVAERFELYVQGIELANGYHELLEADELLRRNQIANQQRQADGKYGLPNESRLIGAMRKGLPACAGVALGVDRLVMLSVGAQELSEVMPFPIERA